MNSAQKVTRVSRSEKKNQKSRNKKRKQYFNPKTDIINEKRFCASRKKIQSGDEFGVPVDHSVEYRIINFILVFTTLSRYVKCKTCESDVEFVPIETRGLGFKIDMICEKCENRKIESSAVINHTYEINRRFILTMRLLGLGAAGCAKFCGLMDMPQFLKQKSYDSILKYILSATKEVFNQFTKRAVHQEVEMNEGLNKKHLTVSGDGTWKKRGFSSLYGVSSLIGYYTGKIVDVIVKSAYCKLCRSWTGKEDSVEFQEWKEDHQPDCTANHSGSSGKMEVDAILEMFKRSETLHDVKYANYIGDGDSKTYSAIKNADPYENLVVKKKECIGHVQKRMGTRLRNVKKAKNGLGGRGKLTGKMIDKLTVYYGLAIRRNPDSAEKMKNDIWATYYHYSSTDQLPQHSKCPAGEDSWCEWQRAVSALPSKRMKKKTRFLSSSTLISLCPKMC